MIDQASTLAKIGHQLKRIADVLEKIAENGTMMPISVEVISDELEPDSRE